MNEKTIELIMKYRETFGVGFPTFAVGNDEEEIVKEIEKSLDSGKEYETDLPIEFYIN